MGRFKIYDPRKLVRIENDSCYGKCLLCERKLKTVMGNIKRHYEQIHSVYLDANARKSKKYKSRRSNVKESIKDEEPIKRSIRLQTLANVKKQNTMQLESLTTSTSSPRTNENNNLTSTLNKSSQESETNKKENVQLNKTSVINQQMQPSNSSTLVPPKINPPIMQKTKVNEETEPISILQSDQQLPIYQPTSKKAKTVEDNNQIHIPCYSFINNIEIKSVDSCHQLDFLKCLVETKAHVNIPLKTLQNEDTFQKALQNWQPNFQFNYSPQTIGEHIDRMTKKLHQEIKKLVANRLVHLKLDIASSPEGNVMLVNVQFIHDFQFQVITLIAIELSGDDLAAFLKQKVLSILQRFRIEICNVFSITKDNTNNVRKNFEKCKKVCESPADTEYCQNLSPGFPGHAIHFVASDIIKLLNENISQSRDSAKKLQNQMYQLKTKSAPLLDNNTNWFSVYDMIESLINVYNEIENNSLLLVEVDWLFAKKFVESFKPIVDTAIMLQTNEIVLMGDFYREWLLCEMKLKELAASNELALYLLEVLNKRKLEFFENSSFLAALYLDPRFCYMGSLYMTDKQKEMAIVQLLQIFNKLKIMHVNITDNLNINARYGELEKQVITSAKSDIDAMNCYELFSLKDTTELQVKEYLNQLQFEARLPFKTNILEYWKVVKYKNPLLAKIAEIALAAPATQATLNRALNASSITLLKRKLNENTENIKNLLLLKLNEDLVNKISLEN